MEVCVKARHRILLYGNWPILGTIGLSLGRNSQLEVTKLEPPLTEPQQTKTQKRKEDTK
jgi:hypothetical protein